MYRPAPIYKVFKVDGTYYGWSDATVDPDRYRVGKVADYPSERDFPRGGEVFDVFDVQEYQQVKDASMYDAVFKAVKDAPIATAGKPLDFEIITLAIIDALKRA